MPERPNPYRGHRFPREVIAHAVRLYLRFALSFRDVEELLAERGVEVRYETVRRRVAKFRAQYAEELCRRETRSGCTWPLDEMATHVGGRLHWLWRAVDEHGQTLDVLLQAHRDTAAAARFFRPAERCGLPRRDARARHRLARGRRPASCLTPGEVPRWLPTASEHLGGVNVTTPPTEGFRAAQSLTAPTVDAMLGLTAPPTPSSVRASQTRRRGTRAGPASSCIAELSALA